jgi:hypothetical protein
MISLTPNSTPQDTNGAFAVLAVISDPAAAKKRLAELIDASKEFEAALKAAQEAEAKAREAASTLDKRGGAGLQGVGGGTEGARRRAPNHPRDP